MKDAKGNEFSKDIIEGFEIIIKPNPNMQRGKAVMFANPEDIQILKKHSTNRDDSDSN